MDVGSTKLKDFLNRMHERKLAQEKKNILLPEVPKINELQKAMLSDPPVKELYKKAENGYISAATRREAVSVTQDALENMHRSLASCPGESEQEKTPSSLSVPLLPHQERALKWLLWRETQSPAGGILADDMGLGKTLTMISLIVRQKELDSDPPASSDVWLSKTVKIKRSSGTLVVCPASVVGQWENEIHRRCKRNMLTVVIFHGADRQKLAETLHQYDVVITTYQIVSREIANVSVDKRHADSQPIGDFDVETHAKEINQSILLQIAFNRIILDEAHVIRNPKSGVSQSVCRLRALRRWVVTGTPVQNKELDMYSLLRFLRVSPFDQLAVWKRWVDSSKAKNAQATDRLQLLIKTLLLRRTKDQKTEGTETPLVTMPNREVHTHELELTKEENVVYQKLLAFSRKALEDYIESQERRAKDGYTFNRQALPEFPQKGVTKQMMLVLLLRLRQVCSHPALIKTMLDTTDKETMGSEDAKIQDDSNDVDLIAQMSNINLGEKDKDKPEEKEEDNFFKLSNPIFNQENISSKLKYIIEEVRKVIELGQKAVVVSQWTSMLEVIAIHFRKLRIRTHLIAGNVPIKERTAIVEDFNTNPHGKPVILLSLAAGGVGLNLIGGNHLFMADMHWNPQLEAQACDRVYRVGQKRDVHVHRMVTIGTVEERILELQKRKLDMANGILTGAAKLATKGLTIEDLKMLFNPSPPSFAPRFNSDTNDL